jgi:two-component system response regulator
MQNFSYRKSSAINKKNKILLVEDNPNDTLLAQRAFRKCDGLISNCQLDCVTDGEQAVEYLSRNPKPTAILLDLNLPRMDGFQLLEYIRSNNATRLLPVIVLTSSTEEKDIAHAYHLGANSYINKPINFTHFHEVVQLLSYYWLVINENPKSVLDF